MDVVEVATFSTEAEAVYWAERLQAEGIPSVRVPLGGGLAVFATAAPMLHALRVPAGDADRARGLLREREATPPRRRRRHKHERRQRERPSQR